jgi:WYL domain
MRILCPYIFMSRKGQSITLSLQEADKVRLEKLALEFGKTWGDRPNISKLIEAIARRKLLLAPNHDWTVDRIGALNLVRTTLMDLGQMELAVQIAQILCDRGELTLPLRQELEQFIAQPLQPWRVTVEQLIKRQQPFQLSYQDASERIWNFSIHHAQIATHESRQYLDCWCGETADSQDLPELIHNRCFRLDRIIDAAIHPIQGQWRSDLDLLEVEFHLLGTLAFAYHSKNPRDVSVTWLTDSPTRRQVIRQVPNTFWLLRDILRYGADCVVIRPKSLRDKLHQTLQKMIQNYTDEIAEPIDRD